MASASSLFGAESVIERIYIASSITFNPPYNMIEDFTFIYTSNGWEVE